MLPILYSFRRCPYAMRARMATVSKTHQDVYKRQAATLPRVLTQVDLALINTNYALAANLNPSKDALAIEGAQSPYANIIATRADNANSPAIKKLIAALNSPAVKAFILEKYKGAIVPAF